MAFTRAQLKDLFGVHLHIHKKFNALIDSMWNLPDDGAGGGGGGVQSVNSGTNITVDNTDAANPVLNFSGVTLYSGDGTLSANRTIDQDNKILSFVNAARFEIWGVFDDGGPVAIKLFDIDNSVWDVQLGDMEGKKNGMGAGFFNSLRQTIIGDFLDAKNGTRIIIDDTDVLQGIRFVLGGGAGVEYLNLDMANQRIKLTATNGVGINQTPTVNSPFAVGGLTNYANNAAAISAGLVAGEFYRTGGAVMVVI